MATARISIPCFLQFSVRLLTRSRWNCSRCSPLMNWPPVSFEPPIRQSDRLSGVMILAMISSSIASPLASSLYLTKTSATFSGMTRNSMAPSRVIGKPSDERKSISPSWLRLNRFDRQSTRLTRVS